jgi:hypothetical protein
MFRPEFRSSSGHDITRETEIALRKKKSYSLNSNFYFFSPLMAWSCPEFWQFLFFYFILFFVFFNLLKPPGHVMHQQFNIQQLYALPKLYYLCVLYLSENKQRLVTLTA